ncbi:ion transporter [Chlorobium phaeovibrioides]|uniref:Ion transporter n=1 Tax=Chlorobium phaeovibrioides TaxID=1094 RepID=A0A432AXD4_CHLPH|nr:ion transporter [Chlorobium phaeovibrioides]MWV53825.1 ion transporter [Chlorobium phaeovibrioides]QEQ56399.1 ion transporter [Chlorobium phaeovibrioides]RTY36582.1 ion transporter [Chlorobium phaeovibrioides]RTY39497.1 ion transporter [Chlorobium phaeovibrioides]
MREQSTLRGRLRHIIFDYDTLPAKAFDLALIVAISCSVLVVMLDSVGPLHTLYGPLFLRLEWFFTFLFSIEYLLRIYTAKSAARYMRSFFGIIDVLSIFPTWLSLFIPGTQYLLVIRFFRVLRIFRLLKLMQYVKEANFVRDSIAASARKIFVFLFFVFVLASIVGGLMYMIEGEENGFRSIPEGIYWAIVTVTTVGYGDISPQTTIGRVLAALLMITGYSVIAVPTGIVTSEMSALRRSRGKEVYCPNCPSAVHSDDSRFCRYCGTRLQKPEEG